MKTVIEMAREAGLIGLHEPSEKWIKEFSHFAELVRADERESVMQLFTDPENQPTQYGTVTMEYMQREIRAEREACAIAGGLACRYFEDMGRVQNAIRARGNT